MMITLIFVLIGFVQLGLSFERPGSTYIAALAGLHTVPLCGILEDGYPFTIIAKFVLVFTE